MSLICHLTSEDIKHHFIKRPEIVFVHAFQPVLWTQYSACIHVLLLSYAMYSSQRTLTTEGNHPREKEEKAKKNTGPSVIDFTPYRT